MARAKSPDRRTFTSFRKDREWRQGIRWIIFILALPSYACLLLVLHRYCPTGTLRSQLLYPSTEPGDGDDEFVWTGANWSDEQLLEVLDSVDLPDLAARAGDGDPIRGINAVLDWTNTLSLGEQQRLAFGRLLVNRPRLVIMDESTSALDVAAEKKMYALLKGRLRSNTGEPVTYVSVGHRPTLMAYHDLKLLLRDGSGFASFIPQNASSSADQESILRSLQR